MNLNKKEKSKIICKHLIKNNCEMNETYLISAVMDALKEIEDKEDEKLYAVWAENEETNPMLIGIAKSPKTAIAMTDLANKELGDSIYFEYSCSAYTPNAVGLNDVVHIFDNAGNKKLSKPVAGNNFCHTESIVLESDFDKE